MNSLIFRLHEWAADHFSFIQYPRLTRVEPPKPFFKHQMPWYTRVQLIFFSLAALFAGLILLVITGLILWVLISSFFS